MAAVTASKSSDRGDACELLDRLVARCTFPPPPSALACGFSGGADSTALIALARHRGLGVVAHHVDHGIRPESGDDAERARAIAESLDVTFVLHRVDVEPGPNLEARARAARFGVLPPDVATAHTADDQAETIVIRLLRGSGRDGLAAMSPGPRRPLLDLRRADTQAVCDALGIVPVDDPTNRDATQVRSRVRHELLPLADDIARRDLVPVLVRTADVLRAEQQLLDELAATLDPTDAREVSRAHPALARRAIRRWLTVDGYPPDLAAVERVLAVARGDAIACELAGGRRVARSGQRLAITPP